MRNRLCCFLLLLFVVATVCGCKREPVIDAHPEMEGRWSHSSTSYSSQLLIIGNSGRGYIERYLDGELEYDSNPRKWFIKNEILFFGRISGGNESFGIIRYPVEATQGFTSEYDTVSTGETYMVLDNQVYVKLP